MEAVFHRIEDPEFQRRQIQLAEFGGGERAYNSTSFPPAIVKAIPASDIPTEVKIPHFDPRRSPFGKRIHPRSSFDRQRLRLLLMRLTFRYQQCTDIVALLIAKRIQIDIRRRTAFARPRRSSFSRIEMGPGNSICLNSAARRP